MLRGIVKYLYQFLAKEPAIDEVICTEITNLKKHGQKVLLPDYLLFFIVFVRVI